MQTPSLANCIRVWYVAFQLPNQHAVLIHLADKGTPNLPDLPLKVLWSFRIGSFGRAERRTSRSTGTCSAPCWTEPSTGCASPSPPAISGTGASWASCRTSWRCPLGRSQTARGRRTPSASRSRRRRPPSWWRRWASDTGSEGRQSSALWGRRQGCSWWQRKGGEKRKNRWHNDCVCYLYCMLKVAVWPNEIILKKYDNNDITHATNVAMAAIKMMMMKRENKTKQDIKSNRRNTQMQNILLNDHLRYWKENTHKDSLSLPGNCPSVTVIWRGTW